jgi:hypothetical protein
VPVRKGAGRRLTLSEEFKALWDRIKHKTTYRVQFDNDKLIRDCTAALTRDPHIAKARLQWRKAEIGIGKAGVEAREKEGAYTVTLDEADIELPDLLTDLQDRTQLTRRTHRQDPDRVRRLDDFKRNPQQFIEQAAEIINRCKRLALVDGIKYQRLGDDAVYAQELFEQEELTGYLTNMLDDTKRSIYEHVVYDSATERDFADAWRRTTRGAVRQAARLVQGAHPAGQLQPRLGRAGEQGRHPRLYFVVETKSSLFTDDLRNKESAKIECGKAHFKALASLVASDVNDRMSLETRLGQHASRRAQHVPIDQQLRGHIELQLAHVALMPLDIVGVCKLGRDRSRRTEGTAPEVQHYRHDLAALFLRCKDALVPHRARGTVACSDETPPLEQVGPTKHCQHYATVRYGPTPATAALTCRETQLSQYRRHWNSFERAVDEGHLRRPPQTGTELVFRHGVVLKVPRKIRGRFVETR